MAVIIDGKAVSKKILEQVKKETEGFGKKPCLAVIIAGDDPASKIYVNNKRKTALGLGFESIVKELPENISESGLIEEIEKLNNDGKVNAILVQLPLPKHINSEKIIETIKPGKDVDCFHPSNVGKIAVNSEVFVYPCTPKGILSLLEEYGISVEGKNAVVIGRSNIVGRPLSMMLVNKNATVTLCHSKTQNLKEITKSADILISAVGKPKFIKREMVKEGAVVIDVGITRGEDGKLSGDVDFESVKDAVSFITPVPGGVGPMTICSLMQNTLELFKQQNQRFWKK